MKLCAAVVALSLLVSCKSGDPGADDPPVKGSPPAATAKAPTTAPPPAPARAGKHVDFDPRIAWKPWDDAQRAAKAEGRPIMVVVYADWCPHCRELSPVFADPEIQKLSEGLVMVHENSDADPAWLKAYANLGSYVPRILFLGPDGTLKAELTSGNGRYPYFYTPQGVDALKTSMKRASGSLAGSPPKMVCFARGAVASRSMAPGWSAALLVVFALIPACKRGPAGTKPVPSASAATATPSAGSAPVASASAPVVSGPPRGTGVATWAPLDAKECVTKGRDLEPNLAFGGIAIAARGKELAVAWHYVSGKKGEGLIAFSGYDAYGRTLAVAHGLGKGTPFAAQIFPRKDAWLVTWFDAQSLLFANASWAPNLPTAVRLNAITADEAGETAILATKGGLVGAAALGPGKREQLGLFLFAPEEEGGEAAKAIAATHHATVPEHPAVAELDGSWILAWDDELTPGAPRAVVVTRFDASSGKESEQEPISTPGRTATRPSIANVAGGALIAWVEQDGVESAVVVRSLDAKGRAASATARVARGAMPLLTATKDGAILSMVRTATDADPPQVAAVRISANGEPSSTGRLVSELAKGKGAVSQPAGVAYVADEDRLGFVWTYLDGMRGHLTTAKAEGCF